MNFKKLLRETLEDTMNDIKSLDSSDKNSTTDAKNVTGTEISDTENLNSNNSGGGNKNFEPTKYYIGNWKGNNRAKALACGDKLVIVAPYVKGIANIVNILNRLSGNSPQKIYDMLPSEKISESDLKFFKPLVKNQNVQ